MCGSRGFFVATIDMKNGMKTIVTMEDYDVTMNVYDKFCFIESS